MNDQNQAGASAPLSAAQAKRGVASTVYDWTNYTAVITFHDGQKLTVDPKEYPDHVRKMAEVFGFTNKYQNSYATNSGIKDAALKAFDMMKQLLAGQWNMKREGTGGMLAEAIARKTGKDIAEAAAIVNKMTKDDRKALEKHPEVKVVIATIQAERAERAAANAKADEDKPLDWDAIA